MTDASILAALRQKDAEKTLLLDAIKKLEVLLIWCPSAIVSFLILIRRTLKSLKGEFQLL